MTRRALDLDALARRMSALCDAVRGTSRDTGLVDELRVSHALARLTYSTQYDGRPRPAAWLDEWDAIARDVATVLADEAGTASHADAPLARARQRRWDHHASAVRVLLEHHARRAA